MKRVVCLYITLTKSFVKPCMKQNRESTEEYSESIVRKKRQVRKKDRYQQVEHMQVPKGRDQVSGGVSVPCWHATPVTDALWKLIFGEMSNSVNVKSGNNATN